MKKGEVVPYVLLIAILAFGTYWAYINGFIFEGDHWSEQVGCVDVELYKQSNCNRVLHPTYLSLVLFSGTCVALAFNILNESITFENPISKIKYHLKQQVNEIKAMGSIQFELCFRSCVLVLCTFLFGILVIRYAVWHNCFEHIGVAHPASACYASHFEFIYVFYRIIAFLLLWIFPMVISNFYNFLRFGTTTVTHSDDGNK